MPINASIPESIKPKLAYSEMEAATLIGVSPRTMFDLRKAGKISHVIIPGTTLIRYRASALRAFLRENEAKEMPATEAAVEPINSD